MLTSNIIALLKEILGDVVTGVAASNNESLFPFPSILAPENSEVWQSLSLLKSEIPGYAMGSSSLLNGQWPE